MKRKLITIVTDNIRSYSKEILNTQKSYADRHNFLHFVVDVLKWPDLHPSFSKVWEIHQALEEGYDQLIWADADVAFMDMSQDLMELLKPNYFMAAYQQMNWKTWAYLCNGLIVMQNTPQAVEYVKEWIRRVETRFMKDHPWEQWYFDEIIRETNWNNVRCCTAKEIGCFAPEIWHDGNIWKVGMPTVHFAGTSDWPRRQEVFLKHYQDKVKL